MHITNRGKAWERANSFWLLWPLCIGMGWIGFFWIGVRGRKKSWIVWGIVHLLVWLAAALAYLDLGDNLLTDTPEAMMSALDDALTLLLGLVTMFGWLVQLIQLILCRREYLIRREAILTNRSAADAKIRREATGGAAVATAVEDAVVAFVPSAHRTRVLDFTEEEDAGGVMDAIWEQKIDLNACTAAQLAALPGIGAEKAEKACSLRSANGLFVSAQDFCDQLQLKPHEAVRIDELAYASEKTYGTETVAKTGRLVDV